MSTHMSVHMIWLLGTDACFMQMLAYELRRAGYGIVEAGGIRAADCCVVDLDTVPTISTSLPAIGYSRCGKSSPDCILTLDRPFAIEDLLGALSRLSCREPEEKAAAPRLVFDDGARTVSWGMLSLSLMPAEYTLLRRLCAAPGEAVSRSELRALLPASESNVLEVTICSLRRKLEDAFSLRPIRTVRGVGYRFVE